MTYLKYLVGILILAALVYGGVHWYDGQLAQARADGVTSENAVWTEKQRAADAASTAALALEVQRKAALTAFQNATNLKVDQDHETALTALNARIAVLDRANRANGGMRVSRSICAAPGHESVSDDAGPKTASNGSDDDYLAGTVALPDGTQQRIRAIGIEADTIVEAFRATQHWIVANGFYGFKMPEASPGLPASGVNAQPAT